MKALRMASLLAVLASFGNPVAANEKPLPAGYVRVPASSAPAGGTCAVAEGDVQYPGLLGAKFTGDTSGGANHVQDVPYPACTEYTNDTNAVGPDDVWTITPGSGNSLTFALASTSNWDPHLYVLGTCGDASSCIAGSDDASSSNLDPGLFGLQLIPHQTYYIYVDSFYPAGQPSASGSYVLHVSGMFPVSLQTFRID